MVSLVSAQPGSPPPGPAIPADSGPKGQSARTAAGGSMITRTRLLLTEDLFSLESNDEDGYSGPSTDPPPPSPPTHTVNNAQGGCSCSERAGKTDA